ncbi:inosine 5'-monophosphate dehydrogenase [Rubripirellula lacrimiformis]|uniref:Inosine 5'-monophosphate dehydrogenase n=1 Tax=Rubripirellula lacrimiformis TaxID=1930273 RepID=A0A517NEW5_9BACT|nr:CBS domain-containing protein [Rubripirellula lacrimiformis]QDT05672.1 inosine 5'-monophosphate dehydrogenase [Rubripirellula lacrimiformis]
MKKNEPVTRVMSTELVTIHDHEPVSKLREIFESGDLHHVPVVSGEKLVGIISSNDLMRISFGEFGNQDGKELDAILDHTFDIPGVMNRNPVSLPVTGSIREAARLLVTHRFHALPIVDGDKLVGIVTSTDLLQFLSEL